MRQLINIVNEYQSIPTPDWASIPPRPKDATPVGQVQCKLGMVKLFASNTDDADYPNTPSLMFWGELSDTDVAVIMITTLNEHTILRHAYVLPDFARNSIMSEMINWVIRTKHTPLINDAQNSPDGEVLLQYLCGKFTTSIVYLPTGEKFPISDIGQAKTRNGQTVIDPKLDNTAPLAYDPQTHAGQKFFFLWEATGNVTNIIEGVSYTYGFSQQRHVSQSGYPIRYFYDDGAP